MKEFEEFAKELERMAIKLNTTAEQILHDSPEVGDKIDQKIPKSRVEPMTRLYDSVEDAKNDGPADNRAILVMDELSELFR